MDHMDGGAFRLRLDEDQISLREFPGKPLRDLILRGNGITEEGFTVGMEGPPTHSLVSLD
jgi:hypothetical protein